MSQENVEVVRSLFEAVNRRDYASAVEYVHPEAEICPGIAGLDTAGPGSGSRLCGRDELRQYFEDGANTWETTTVEFEEVTETRTGECSRLSVGACVAGTGSRSTPTAPTSTRFVTA